LSNSKHEAVLHVFKVLIQLAPPTTSITVLYYIILYILIAYRVGKMQYWFTSKDSGPDLHVYTSAITIATYKQAPRQHNKIWMGPIWPHFWP